MPARAQSGGQTTQSAGTIDPALRPTVVPAGAPKDVLGNAKVSRTELSRRTVDVFGDSLILLTPPVLDSSAAAEPTWDMDVRSYETQERVAHYVDVFTGRSKERIAAQLEKGTRYEPMIRAKMKAGGLPEDMYYLALVESGFDNNAYSRAAAVGMWQFMTSTARGMGLRVDWWVDERRDPVKSTWAAVRFIRGLRDQFGSLYLAAAAYNGGPGRVSRGLARYADDLENTKGDDAFFVLAEKDYLQHETREYVPQLIAAALIAKEPQRYGMTLHPLRALRVRLGDGARRHAARWRSPRRRTAASPRSGDLNPHLLRGMTPPRASMLVRVPPGSGERLRQPVRRDSGGGARGHPRRRIEEGRHGGPAGRAQPHLRPVARRLQSEPPPPQAERPPGAGSGDPDPEPFRGLRRARRSRSLDREVLRAARSG